MNFTPMAKRSKRAACRFFCQIGKHLKKHKNSRFRVKTAVFAAFMVNQAYLQNRACVQMVRGGSNFCILRFRVRHFSTRTIDFVG